MKKPRSYNLANLTKLNCIKSNHFSHPGRKMRAVTIIFFLTFSETVVLDAKAQIPTLSREGMFLFPAPPRLLKQGLHSKKLKCSLSKSTRVASPVPTDVSFNFFL